LRNALHDQTMPVCDFFEHLIVGVQSRREHSCLPRRTVIHSAVATGVVADAAIISARLEVLRCDIPQEAEVFCVSIASEVHK
jgi:hypothetical protein